MDKNNKLKLNDQGISLIELIIVLAIMAIIGGAAFLSTTVATDKHVNSCGQKIASSLEQTRGLVMGKRSGYIELSQNAGDYVYLQMWIDDQPYGDRVAVGRPGVTVNLTFDGGATSTLVAEGSVEIHFDRSNGSVVSVGGAAPIVKIGVTNGRRTMNVNIDKFTGRVETKLET